MNALLLTPADYRTMPWKNGHGITHEIAAERSAEDQRTGRFAWRLSMAEVAASAPFSAFPGCDRIILLLEGDGMVLDRGSAGRHVLATQHAPYSFPGEWPIDCQLLGGPCRDFNVMADRSRVRARATILSVQRQSQHLPIDAQTVAIFTLTGSIGVSADSSPPPYEVPARHTLILSKNREHPALRSVNLCTNDLDAMALVIGFEGVGEGS